MKEKLVRDHIPEIIKSSGVEPKYRIASEEEFNTLLIDKLHEEVNELIQAVTSTKKEDVLAEMCDVLEVLATISLANGIDNQELFDFANTKRKANGAFTQRIVLQE